MKKTMLRVISGLLSVVVLVTSMPDNAYAHWDTSDDSKPVSITTAENGNVPVEDNWEDVYPYGAFLFDNSEARIEEGGDEITIPLYRLGGTSGRVTAYLTYAPVVSLLNGEIPTYASAAGSDDVIVKVENVLPIARYQPVGKDADPDPSGVKVIDSMYTGDDAKAGDHALTIDTEAESYQWYILSEGRWQIVEDAVKAEFIVPEDLMDGMDFRCVFTKDGKKLSSDTMKGESYVKPEAEELPEMPKDLDLKPEQSFSELEADTEDPYAARMFAVTFAEGEWKKELKVSAPDNDKANPARYGTFTIIEHEGGEIFNAASTVTLKVTDNDKSEPYTLGFIENSISAGKTQKAAVLKLKRIGGGQEMITVDWATADGTAVAGNDYVSSSGTAVFYADIDEVTIEIPLINNGIKSDDDLNFFVELGELKGDPEGLCSLTDKQAEIKLTNNIGTDSTEGDLVTIMPDENAAVIDDEPVTGKQEITPDEDLLYGKISGYDEEEGDGYSTYTYNYGNISFSGKHGDNYWNDEAYVAGKSKNDITGWNGGYSYGNGWQIKGDDDKTAILNIDHMAQKYSIFNGSYEFNAELDSGWHFTDGYAYGSATVRSKSGTKASASSNPRLETSGFLGTYRTVYYENAGWIDAYWNIDDEITGLTLNITKFKNKSKEDAYSRITSGYLTRRTFDGNLNLRIHTANDGERGNGNVATAPSGGASLKAGSGVYKSIKPEVLVEERSGGVNSSGRLYVGSKLKISLKNTDSYKPYSGSALNAAVYVTRSNGKIVNAKVEPGKDGSYYVTMLWDGITLSDLSDNYTLNVVMTRSQNIELNLRPSVPRKIDEKGKATEDIDNEKVGEAWYTFWRRGSQYITVGLSEAQSTAPHFKSNKIKEVKINKTSWRTGDKNPLKILGKYENIQYINFNRARGDRIVINKKAYKGNDKIYLTVEDLAFAKISFSYYQEEYINKPNVMETSVNRVELYLDGDGDGRIAGHYDDKTGYFVLDSDTKDIFEMYLEEGGNYDEVDFEPVDLGGGKFGQHFAKVFYTMTPRYLEAPKGDKGYAQVLPAFTTSRTDEEKRAQLTSEQNSYRYVLSGKDETGRRTSDNHIMNGVEATGMQYVDVPLGGDHSPLEQVEKGVYSWTPDYDGNLIYPFNNPEPIFIEHSLIGDNIALAEFSRTGTGFSVPEKGKANLNGYLGSFTGDTTIALCVVQQEHTADELHAAPDTAKDLHPESSTLTGRAAAPNAAWLSNMDSSDMGSPGFDTKDSGQKYDEFNLDYNSDLNITKASYQGLVTVVTGKNSLAITISIPAYTSGQKNDGEWKDKKVPKTITDPTEKSFKSLGSFMEDMKNGGYDNLLESLKEAGFEGAEGGNLKCKSKSFKLNFSLAMTLKYDTKANCYYVQDFACGISGQITFKTEVRLTVCPLLYGYMSIDVKSTVGSGGTVKRTEVESKKPIVEEGKIHKLNKNESMEFSTAYVNMYVRFKGKIYMEVLDSKNASSPSAGTNKGYLSSAGGEKVHVQLTSSKSGMTFDEGKSVKYVRIYALEDTTISYINTIESMKSELTWSGVSVKPQLTVEVGVGAGVEGLKVEACIRAIISANFVFGQQQADGSRSVITVDKVTFSLSIALKCAFIGFSMDVDAIGVKTVYDGKTDEWTAKYILMGKEHNFDEDILNDKGEAGDEILQLPKDVSGTQTIYSDQKEPLGEDDLSIMAYDPDDGNVPFMLSGYNSSVDAFRLADGLDLGYDYRVVTANGVNYVAFTIGRPDGKGMDKSMLVLSRLVLTGEGYGKDLKEKGNTGNGLGLVNPLDWEEVEDDKGNIYNVVKAPGERSDTPYILVDLKKAGDKLVDDGTGDIEFDISVTDNVIDVAWVSYAKPEPDPGSDTRAEFQKAVKNTVVKHASYDVTKKDGFSEAVTISNPEGGAAVYLPTIVSNTVSENHILFAKAHHVTEADRASLVDRYKEKLNKLGFYADQGDEAGKSIYRYRMTTYENELDRKGDGSSICVYVNDQKERENRLFEFSTSGGSGSIKPIDKLKGLQNGNDLYAAYTTWIEDMDPDAPDGQRDSALNYAVLRDEQGSVTCPYPHRTVSMEALGLDGHKNFDTLQVFKKGIYNSTALGNEWNGNMIIVGQGGKVFLLKDSNVDEYVSSSGGENLFISTTFFGGDGNDHKTGFAFGEDGDGNLATVYVDSVDNTSNTGLYLSRYDAKNRVWGKGVLLAMRYMNIYESAGKYGWSDEDTTKAYLGELEGYNMGGMDQFQFYNPQIAMGTKGEPEKDKSTDIRKSNTTLVILTQGNMRYLTYEEAEGEKFLTTTDAPSGAKFKEGMGIYAVSYGIGDHSIGNGSLKFRMMEFTAGATQNVSLSFANTGDIGIRGSKDNPITVELGVDGADMPATKLATWTIEENIKTGGEVRLSGEYTLPVTLPEGSAYYVSISEDTTYAEDPFSATISDLYIVPAQHGLGFESSSITPAIRDNGKLSLDAKGNVILDVDLFVGNRGTKDIANAYLQFKYGVHDPVIAEKIKEENGEGSDWNDIIYDALSLDGNTLEVGEEEALPVMTVNATSTGSQKGIFNVGSIRAGYGRHIKGTIKVSADKFLQFSTDGGNDPSGTLNIAAEIFDENDEVTVDEFGVHHAENNNHIKAGCFYENTIDHMTSFVVPNQLEVPAGMRLRLPVSFSTTLGSNAPDISAVELSDCEITDNKVQTSATNMDQTMETIFYEAGSYKNGYGTGTIVIKGAKEGNSYVRIQDANTNSYQDIAIMFTAQGSSIDITNSVGLFTFYDETGKVCKTGGKSWVYTEDTKFWGKDNTEPYKKTLSRGKVGTKFSFVTEAEKIALWFDGEAIISSDFPDFRQMTLESDGKKKMISLGSNPQNKPHNVMITVTKAGTSGSYADFDEMIEYYYGDKVDSEDDEKDNKISVIWDAHFPGKGTLKSGQVFDVTMYIVDNTSSETSRYSHSVQGNNVIPISMGKASYQHYAMKVRFTGNGPVKIKYQNSDSGCYVTSALDVDWWAEKEDEAAELVSPALKFYKIKYPTIKINADRDVTGGEEIVNHNWMGASWDKTNNTVKVRIDPDAPTEQFDVHLIEYDEYLDTYSINDQYPPISVSRGSTGTFTVSENGFYLVEAEATIEKTGNEDMDYYIYRTDGSIEEYNGEDEYYYNADLIRVGEEDSPEDEPVNRYPIVQYLPGNTLSFNSVSDADMLFLSKDGKYTYEEGLEITPAAKGAVKVNTKTRSLSVKKDSLLTLTKDGMTKSAILYVQKVKGKTVTLNSRKKTCTLTELFTEEGSELLPDVENGHFMIQIKKDKNGILKNMVVPDADDKYVEPDDIVLYSTGNKGSATVTATFGGKTYTATVKCGGYPVLNISGGDIVQNLNESDPDGNRVLTFDSVDNGDTLLLLKNGKYALEQGVDIKPVGESYKDAVKVLVNKKTGIRKLNFKKEAPVRLTKTVEDAAGGTNIQEKVILVNLVTIKKKSVTMNTDGACSLGELFTGAYEMLPDVVDDSEYNGYAVSLTDKKGVLYIWEGEFPLDPEFNRTSLNDYIISASGRKGTATVSVSFGGRVFKTTIKCK